MTTISEIQDAVRALPERQFEAFSSWFDQYEEERWDNQIEKDQKSGVLLDLINKAKYDFKAGKCARL
jgi:hypothetical protein